ARIVGELKQTNRQLDRNIYELNTLLDLSKDFNKLVDREEIIRIFKFTMLGQMLIRNFFFLLEQDGRRSIAAFNNIKGELTDDEINALFNITRDVFIVDDNLSQKIPFLKNNNIHALISLEFQNARMAVVGISKPANKDSYSEADFKFLQSLGNLALLSIQKTLLLEARIEKERLEEELNIAKNIQKGLLPNPIPTHPALDIAASNVSSRQVGGDYFDILEARNKKLLFAIGDVTGKGTPAALLMANLQAIIHVLLPIDISLEEATGRINNMIYRNTPDDKFVTFFWGLFDPETAAFSYVNAGHNPVLVFQENSDNYAKLEEGGLILGAMPTMNPYKKETVNLKKGDLLVFYTDGVTEALNPDETEEYEEKRLIECIRQNKEKSAQEVIDAVIDDVNRWSYNTQHDDITIMALKVR
ncbi:MAG TPA: PP2C family protein-serine/threonine phosphatase, partial [Balneolaceae bacterium]|nr:PP2C family protein-serine/threonine phosphatase [Balneolaceae bacterium]